ncbi:MAG: hypothetical protein KDB68_10215 [Planctomycetes bacterium]|nr:hypothetical protein [Planctomycetota bacterium]
MNRFKLMAMATLAAGAFALSACGGANNAAKPPVGNQPAGNAGNDAAPADNQSGKDNGGEDKTPEVVDVGKLRKQQVEQAWTFLKTQYNKPPSQDDPRGLLSGWGPQSMNVPYTDLVLQGLVGTDVWKSDDPMFRDSLDWLLKSQEPSGAWSYMPGVEQFKGIRAVYITGIMAQLLSDLNEMDAWKGKLDSYIGLAVDYLKQSQVGNDGGPAPDYDENTTGYGGWAYSKEEIADSVGKRGKPPANMSTTSFAIDALHQCGVSEDDPLWDKALTFLKRSQNAGEVQDEGFEAFATVTDENGKKVEKKVKMAGKDSPDYGGAIYSEETSMADGYDANEDGSVTLFSYGSMTYNLLRAYIFAGLSKDSLPVKLARGWIQRNYTVERVPGFRKPEQYEMGLYYYYLSMSKTLETLGEDTIEEPDRGLKHDWRKDVVSKLGELQSDDGSWINEKHDRWQENSRVLCTAYALNALRHTNK